MKILSTLKWCLILLLCFSFAEVSAQTKKRIRKKSKLSYKISLDWLNGGTIQEPSVSIYNPGNQIFKLPDSIGRSELILDSKFGWGSRHKLIARPRLLFQTFQASLTNPNKKIEFSDTEVDFLEIFTESWLSQKVSFTLGLQNYQWGPAEIIAPSNPVFHFDQNQRSLLWREKGHALVRLNWTPTSNQSYVLMSEFVSNDEDLFIHDKKFKPKFILKSEFRSKKAAEDYLGFTLGTEEESRNFLGSYFSKMLSDGISFYSDFRVTENPYRYVPVQQSALVYNLQEASETKDWLHLAVVGFRWETPSFDTRLEWISNGLGYSEKQFRQALDSTLLTNPNFATNLLRLNGSGLELLGQNYGYFSIRFPDLGSSGLWQLQLRYLVSGLDESSVAGFSLERSIGNNFVLLSEGRQAIGKQDLELTLQEKYSVFLGLRFLL